MSKHFLTAALVLCLPLFIPPTAPNDEAIVLEDFESAAVGEYPADWEWRGWGEVEEKPYRVREERGNRFLRAEDTGQNVILYKRIRWNIKEYPYLSWRWRIRAVPEGADERYEERADNAAGLYLTYRRKLRLLPQSIKFVWSTELPVGSAFRRSGIGMPWTIVAGSGSDAINRWQTFTINALAAYRETYGGDPPDRPLGVGLLSDANSTKGRAFADYDDIVVLRRAEPTFKINLIQRRLFSYACSCSSAFSSSRSPGRKRTAAFNASTARLNFP